MRKIFGKIITAFNVAENEFNKIGGMIQRLEDIKKELESKEKIVFSILPIIPTSLFIFSMIFR